MTDDARAFTCFYPSHSLVLANQVKVLSGERSLEVPAVWDTGATRTCVSTVLADRLGLESRGAASHRYGMMSAAMSARDMPIPARILASRL